MLPLLPHLLFHLLACACLLNVHLLAYHCSLLTCLIACMLALMLTCVLTHLSACLPTSLLNFLPDA